MRISTILASAGFATLLAGCATIPGDMSVADYCANASNVNENVCRLKVEIDGNSTSLAQTNMSLSEARSIADSAVMAAADAQASADAAQATADRALSLANSAMLKDEDLVCTTNTIRQSNIGTCQPGYKLMGCTQTRYTTRAGGLSFLREVNDEQCRFNSQVLEMQVRCCTTAEAASQVSTAANGY
ncbi:MAG: hypothetical protein QNI84_16510 [Henriciella sp.]|nr:hypothetical protein [Henriciella sp.]